MADDIGRMISEAHVALEPMQVAQSIFRALFENGPNRVSGSNKFVAVGTIVTGLIEWKKQLLAAHENEAAKWKKQYEDTKNELDNVRLKLAILQKEQ
jgi:hypothetical protein